MKQKYLSPEFEVTILLTEDILNESPENEIGIPSDSLWD